MIGVECDVASEESVKIAFDQTIKRFGRVDAVVASAGRFIIRIVTPHEFTFHKVSWRTTLPLSMLEGSLFPSTVGSSPLPAYRYPFDRARKLFDVNVHGAYLTAREAAKIMIPNGGGSIVLIASMSASVSPIHFPIEMVLYVTATHPGGQHPTSRLQLLTPHRVMNGLQHFSRKRPITLQKLVRLHMMISECCDIHLL